MNRTLVVLVALLGAGTTTRAALGLAQSGTNVGTKDTARLAAPVRGDFAAPVDNRVRLQAAKRAVIAMDHQWRAAELRNDAVLLDSMLADEWTSTEAAPGGGGMGLTGTVQTKAHFLADVKSGERSYESIAEGEISVQTYGDAVVLTGRATSKGYLKDQRISETSDFTRMYAKRQGRWQMIASRSSVALT
jgi:hypothetical protein